MKRRVEIPDRPYKSAKEKAEAWADNPMRAEEEAAAAQARHIVDLLFYIMRRSRQTLAEIALGTGVRRATIESWKRDKLPTLESATRCFAYFGYVLEPRHIGTEAISLDPTNPHFELTGSLWLEMEKERDRQTPKSKAPPEPPPFGTEAWKDWEKTEEGKKWIKANSIRDDDLLPPVKIHRERWGAEWRWKKRQQSWGLRRARLRRVRARCESE